MKYSCAAAVVLLAALAAAGQPPARPVRSLKLDPVPFDDVSDVLRVLKRTVRFTLAEDAPEGALYVDFYNAGKKVRGRLETGFGYNVALRPEDKREFQFGVQFADLDYLPLGSGPKDHVRMLLKLRVGNDLMTVSATKDIPKSVFDYSKGIGGGQFPETSGTATEVPLFYVVTNATNFKVSRTPKEAVDNHPDAQVAIFYFRRGDEPVR
jgi:hypothetical protein